MVIKLGEHYFDIIENYREAFNQEQFENRYSEVLDKYPVIVGDIGFEQLRLKGFYEDRNKKADISKRFSSIQDYLLEYCNFGCPYFVLRRLTAHEVVRMTAEDIDMLVTETIDVEEEPVEVNAESITQETTAKTLKQFLK
ncbi:YutD family protein [Macrococcus lamae]|uniref:DUF1027 domain-containing protein n=1 Tax=Macrococcus lamae TaxID=198484 RepID=A0A4R6BWG5_9STAP|nr:YutD family protein [Macrococcus lamae]TDM12551.1 DUF1027 domain-containing protein [Macrococcus lamae]